MKSLCNSSPFFGFALQQAPKMLHNNLVIIPIICGISKHLQLGVGNIPWLV